MEHSQILRRKPSISIYLLALFFLFVIFSISPILLSPTLAKPAFSPEERKAMAMNKMKAMEQASGGPLKFTLSRKSELATFLATKQGKEIPIRGHAFGNAKERARSFLKDYGNAFGLKDPSEFKIIQDRGPDLIGMEHVRIQQLFKGIPITGGQLTVHMRGSLVSAVHAKTLGGLEQLQTSPTVDPTDAITSAKQIVKKYYGITNAVYSTPRLEIFNRGLLDGSTRPTQLAWFIEAQAEEFREFIWIHAQTGGHLLNFSQVTDAKNRQVYNSNSGPSLPGTLLRTEGGPPSGDNDADLAYDYSGDTYDYFLTEHGRDSYDDAGAPLVSTVHHCPTGQSCPYANAFWNGTQMVYGTGYAQADDVVGHELTHAVTENSANLFYYMQSGALNESYSDIFGETVDLTNVGGNDTPAVRWLMGEDLPIGAIRNMMTPTQFNDPGKVSDNQFWCRTDVLNQGSDNGGVHINSGVPNHAYALMVDGGSYNGFTIAGIGLLKADKIQFRALTQYLTSASNFIDNYHALNQSCSDLIGIYGITQGDCFEVTQALDAVEMANPWPCTPQPAAMPPLCPVGQTPNDIFIDNLENTGSGNWFPTTQSGVNAWEYPPTTILNIFGPFATSGTQFLWGYDRPDQSDSSIEMSTDVEIPVGGAFLQFNHAHFFEDSGGTFWDGGVVEYSTNGGLTWVDAGSLITAGQPYGGTLNGGNPLGARQAFVTESFGYTASQLNLASIAGQNVRFQFRAGSDTSVDDLGWFIDDVRIYQCLTTQGPTVTIEQAIEQADPTNASPINFTVVFSESVADFATGDVILGGTAGATTGTVTGNGTTYNVAVSGMTTEGTVIATIAAGIATNSLGNPNSASTSTDNTVTFSTDTIGPTVTLDQPGSQLDPTNTSLINFTVIFSEVVTDFMTEDVTLTGTAGATTATVTGSGTTYNVAVTGMSTDGTVIASLEAGVATDGLGNANSASTSTDNTVTFSTDTSGPTVTVEQAVGQSDPTNTSPSNFTVVFSEVVTDFATGDVTLSGTAGATTATVTGSGTTYNVAVSGMITDGTIIASLGTGVATDSFGNANSASTSTDNTVTFSTDTTGPTVTIEQAAVQLDPTNTSPIYFTAIFSEVVTDFTTGDVTLNGTAGATTGTVTGSGTTYNVAVSGMTNAGTIIATIGAGVATDSLGNLSSASTSTDNTIAFDATGPTVTIDQAAVQLDPTNISPINFTVIFSESVSDFTTGDVTLSGTAGATTGTVTGSGTSYNVAVTGMTSVGTVLATVGSGVATDSLGNANSGSTSTDNLIIFDSFGPLVTIDQAAAQLDPTNAGPINFTVVFSEVVTNFATGDVTLSGTAGATTGTVTGSGTSYNVAVSGMTSSGTVTATIGAGAASDSLGNPNGTSTSTDNDVTFSADPVGPQLSEGQISGITNTTWSTVTLGQTYSSMVVVATPNYDTAQVPVVVRVRNATGNSFEVQAARADGLSGTIPPVDVHYLVVEEGTYTVAEDGVKLEAVTYLSTVTDQKDSWVGESRSYQNSYTTPVVLGQVMTANDPKFSVFWAQGGSRTSPPSSTSLKLGKHVGEDPVPTRADETIGYVVLEAGPGIIGTTNYLAGVGADTVKGNDDGPPFSYPLSGLVTAETAILSVAGMDGRDGGWPVLYGPSSVSPTTLQLVFEEDQLTDSERKHTTEQVAYLVFEESASGPSVTINQAVGQADPTNGSSMNFTVVFTEPVNDFTTGDVTISGAGATTDTVTGSGTTYNVAVSEMTTDGIVTASIAAGVATDSLGNPNSASTSTDNSVTFSTDTTGPTVTIDQAIAQADPSNGSPINFTVVFSEVVTDFATGDVTLSGTAGSTTGIVTGSGTTYNVAVSGMTTDGSVLATIAGGIATDNLGNANSASTSTNNTVTFSTDIAGPTVTIDQAAGQLDPTNTSPINFTVIFSEVVTDFTSGDVTIGGTAGATTALVTGSGTTYNVAVSGMTTPGTVTASLAGSIATDEFGNGNAPSTSTDNAAAYDATGPTVTIDQAAAQLDPTNVGVINFTVIFSEPVTDFTTGDVTLGGSAGATTGTVTGSGTTYNVAVSGMAMDGTVSATLSEAVTSDSVGNTSTASTSTDNTVTYSTDVTGPTVMIDQAAGQLDPANGSPINFTVVFSEPVTDFTTGDITLGGTASATTGTVTGSGTTYNVAVSGMTTDGTVTAAIGAGIATDSFGNPSSASTSTDNEVTVILASPSGPQLLEGRVSGVTNTTWSTVPLGQNYASMVVMATPNYDASQPPLVVRVRNATGNSFEVQAARADGLSASVSPIEVHFLVVEEGSYTEAEDGVKLEAVKYLSTITDQKDTWVGTSQSYQNTYTTPVVFGQVMTANDPNFSVFWAQGNKRTAPPSSTALKMGKHVGEDPVLTRVDETIGYIVLEAGQGTIGTTSYFAGVGADTVQGMDDGPPFSYGFSGLATTETAILSVAGMDGRDGGWPVLYGPTPVSPSSLHMVFDEDQLTDGERKHSTEQVAYIILTTSSP